VPAHRIQEIVPVEAVSSGDSELSEAVAALRGGGVVIYPTETFYALGGDPRSASVVDRVFVLKGRDFSKPLPLIASDRSAVRSVVSQWPASAEALAGTFWPGPLSLLLPASSSVPPRLHAGTGRLAVRVSPHPLARVLAEALGGLIISTSANLSGEPACRRLDEIDALLLTGVDAVLSGGDLEGRQPSTIVDPTVEPPRLVREGAIPWERVLRALGG
jgi:L-threonylcarbamoyladenylate synthase